MTIRQLKAEAREALIGNYGSLIGAYFIISAIAGSLSFVGRCGVYLIFKDSSYHDAAAIAVSSIMVIALSPLYVGTNRLILNVCRGQRATTDDIFYAFRNNPWKIILIELAIYGVALACMLPFIAGSTALFFMPDMAAMPFIFALSAIVSTALIFYVLVGCSLCYFLYVDFPEKSVREIIARSMLLMKGSRLRYIMLLLSFTGIALLGITTLGMAFLWIGQYVSATLAMFYIELNFNYTH